MIKEFKKYDKESVKTVIVPISELNDIFKQYGSDLKISTKFDDMNVAYENFLKYTNGDDTSFNNFEKNYYGCKMNSFASKNEPHMLIASQILGIKILDWKWDDDGYRIKIFYQN